MKKMAIVLISLLALTVIAGCASAGGSASGDAAASASAGSVQSAAEAGTYRQISQAEAQSMMESESDYVILDVRTAQEFAQGHIPGAVNVPVETIGDTPPAELPDPGQLIMVYCRSGNRSKTASEALANMGYTNVVEFGGINTWPGEIVTG